MGIFSCPRCVCPGGAGVFPAGSRGLLKLSQSGRNWQAVSETSWCWGMFSAENNGRTATAILDNLYRKCYNKCNDDNKNVISHQTVKFAL